MTDIVLHDLEPEELDSPELRSLLRLATDYDDARLSRLLVEELPRLTVLTAIPAAVGEGPPVALAAYAPPAPGPSPPRPIGSGGWRALSSPRSDGGTREPPCAPGPMTTRSASIAGWDSSSARPRPTRAGRGGGATTACSLHAPPTDIATARP